MLAHVRSDDRIDGNPVPGTDGTSGIGIRRYLRHSQQPSDTDPETETDPDTFEPEDEKKKSRDVYSKALQNADFVHINPEVDIKAIEEMLHFTRNNVQRKLMFKDMMDSGIYVQQVSHYFDMMAKLTYV